MMSAPRSFMRGLLALLLVGAVQLSLFWLLQFEIPESNRDVVMLVIGSVTTLAGAAVAFYFGTNQHSVETFDSPLPPGRDLPRAPQGDGMEEEN